MLGAQTIRIVRKRAWDRLIGPAGRGGAGSTARGARRTVPAPLTFTDPLTETGDGGLSPVTREAMRCLIGGQVL